MREARYSVSYNAKKRQFSVYKNETKVRVFPTEIAVWQYVMAKQEVQHELGK
jgi:hypothetical protein